MAKLYTVSIRWIGTPSSLENINLIDTTLGTLGDWIRFHGYTWLIWTEATAEQVSTAVRQTVSAADDSVLVIASDPNDFNGYAAPWIWQWLANKRAGSTLAALGQSYTLPPRR